MALLEQQSCIFGGLHSRIMAFSKRRSRIAEIQGSQHAAIWKESNQNFFFFFEKRNMHAHMRIFMRFTFHSRGLRTTAIKKNITMYNKEKRDKISRCKWPKKGDSPRCNNLKEPCRQGCRGIKNLDCLHLRSLSTPNALQLGKRRLHYFRIAISQNSVLLFRFDPPSFQFEKLDSMFESLGFQFALIWFDLFQLVQILFQFQSINKIDLMFESSYFQFALTQVAFVFLA